MASEEKGYDVFISHAKDDGSEYAEHLRKSAGWRRFSRLYFSSMCSSGVDSTKFIFDVLDHCKYFILIITHEATNSRVVASEVQRTSSNEVPKLVREISDVSTFSFVMSVYRYFSC